MSPAKNQTEQVQRTKGGAFLLESIPPDQVFIPEDFTEEQRLIAGMTEAFIKNEVTPNIEEIEHQNFELTVELLRKAGTLGLLGTDIPEEFGGMGLDKVSSMLAAEKISAGMSFSVSLTAHTGIGTWPIVFYGTEAQKRRYLPKMATGEWLGAYALTEPGSGSDALAARTRADLSDDGRYYLLNGQKMWITNAGFADLFITFAKVAGEQFSCFIVERGFPGFNTGKEEIKMGIKGSSTRALMFENVPVPVENLLGEIGKGHLIAFNCLNLGRLKLAASAIGAGKICVDQAVRYARERKQFGRAIGEFGLIQHKLAEMAIRTWACESMVYRTSGLIDRGLSLLDPDDRDGRIKAIGEYAIECAINKVAASEGLDYVADEMLQIYGGNGYSAEYPAERAYRDARINRIFEGTNEINRLLITDMLLRRAMKGELPLFAAARKLIEELLSFPPLEEDSDGPLRSEARAIENSKKIALLVAGAAAQRYMQALAEEQEIVGAISDIVIDVFTMESAFLRTRALLSRRGEADTRPYVGMVQTLVSDALQRIEANGRTALAAVNEGDTLRTQLGALKRLARHPPVNTIAARRGIARRLLEAGRYPF
ncbi:MAG: acyl-CoA dehydrogenase family protein [Acidobacteria bacterium]|nr:acyl-CoA dehydrogenase family protein [Acidobacteriota bacterium]